MTTSTPTVSDTATMIRALVPMAHVVDVEKSIRFYELLGLSATERLTNAGVTNWASLSSGVTMLMLARASGPVDAEQQAVLFYLYCDDVKALRTRLLSLGVTNAEAFAGKPMHATPNNGRCVLYDISHPHHMPAGELRVHDPDGYVLLVGQLR